MTENQEKCQECRPGYYLKNECCVKCSLEGCLDCDDSSICKICDEENEYFLKEGICELCSLEGCLDCESEGKKCAKCL